MGLQFVVFDLCIRSWHLKTKLIIYRLTSLCNQFCFPRNQVSWTFWKLHLNFELACNTSIALLERKWWHCLAHIAQPNHNLTKSQSRFTVIIPHWVGLTWMASTLTHYDTEWRGGRIMVMGCGRKYNGLWGESVTEHWGPHSRGSKGQQNFLCFI